jgi:hypothetical protein
LVRPQGKLLEAGFEKTKKALFLWQSVSLYLEADKISKIAKRQMSMIEKMGEPWKFTIDMSNDPKTAVESFLKECGLKMTEYIQFGEKLDIEPFYCIVEAEKLQVHVPTFDDSN